MHILRKKGSGIVAVLSIESLNESQKVDEAEYLTAKDNDSDDEDKNISLA